VILATDGDFNVGVTSHEDLLRLIERERKSGVFLSVLGVGEGNLQDATMELLADKGNGNYSYLDSVQEANKVLVREAASTLVTIAKDVKVQVEFNPASVSAYRLVGYENRMLQSEDFNDDRKDAGEIGAGHTVTAIYEIVPVGAASDRQAVDPLKYQPDPKPSAPPGSSAELLTVKLRYKAPDGDSSQLISAVILNRVQPLGANLGFASAVAELGMLLRDSSHAPEASFDRLIARARQFRGTDRDGDRAEFVKLAEVAAGLKRLDGR
jgi:Ca-activated chloride channel family protein